MSMPVLNVTSHVARDLLQSAAVFKNEQNVVWEYVSNGLQYIDPGVQPVVYVEIDPKARKIVIRDNGRGMTASDLSRYFQMHGENIDRKRGAAGRGMFGTGKSAAFGIGDVLRLTTVKDKMRSTVELTRQDIEASMSGDSIPVRVLEADVSTTEPNGTQVEVEGIHIKKLDIAAVVRNIERHISRWPNATVIVNGIPCSVDEPSYSSAKEFPTKGTPFEKILGDTKLVVKVAQSPLENEWQGAAILSNAVWLTSTLAGCESKPFSNYIFGEIDVEPLGRDTSPIPPFDMSRSMQLNPKNEIVAAIFAFIGPHIESVRREIEKTDRERRRERDNLKLQSEASAIAQLINKDFDTFREQLKTASAKVPGGKDKLARAAAIEEIGEAIVRGDEFPVVQTDETGTRESPYTPGDEPNDNPNPPDRPAEPAPELAHSAEETSDKGKARNKSRSSSGGGFRVKFLPMGEDEDRARYVREERTIYVNLDHPQIAKAKLIGGIDDVAFRRLAYEVAFSEYAIALSYDMAANDAFVDFNQPIYEVRQAMNRLSRAAASLYSNA